MEQIAVKRAKVGMEEKFTDDLISSLPDHMLHHIMSLMPPTYAASTSVLSHRWEKLWLSFPIIDLDQIYFKSRHKFCMCLRSTLARHDLSALQNLRLRMKLPGSPRLYRHVYKFMNIILQESKILKKLGIEFSDYTFFRNQENVPWENRCVLPNETFSLSSQLTFLSVEGCRFEGCPLVNLPKLKTLVIKNVFITEEFLLELVRGCPDIDSLCVKYCFGIKNARICHPTLKKLVLGLQVNLERLELNVPCVKCIKFHALVDGEGLAEVLGYKKSRKILVKNLETLCLKCLVIKPEVLHNIISIFPNLEKLGMNSCHILGRAQLYSNRLTSLEMTDCLLPEEMDITAPNLENLEYLHNPDGDLLDYMTFRQASKKDFSGEH